MQPDHAENDRELDRLLAGISTYQDVVVGGRTVRRGVRDCESRWGAIEPHLPATGTLLDVGANFAWFCRRWCEGDPRRLAVALEADYRSAAVARHVLASLDHRRIVLATALADRRAVDALAAGGVRFDAAFCLSVLHWIPDHRAFLAGLGRIADRLFVEQPHPQEAGAGVTAVREAIGAIGPYLSERFPNRPVEQLATWKAHRCDDLPRELWMVGPNESTTGDVEPSLAVDPLLALDVAWPPRSWWTDQLSRLDSASQHSPRLTVAGLAPPAGAPSTVVGGAAKVVAARRKAVAQIPEIGVTTRRRRLRRIVGGVLRRWRQNG